MAKKKAKKKKVTEKAAKKKKQPKSPKSLKRKSPRRKRRRPRKLERSGRGVKSSESVAASNLVQIYFFRRDRAGDDSSCPILFCSTRPATHLATRDFPR